MSTTNLLQPLQFRNVLVAPQTPNLQELKQLRIKTKNKIKDVILPTNPPTPKGKRNQLTKKPINKSKQNMPLILNENKKLPKNLSFHFLHTTGNLYQQQNNPSHQNYDNQFYGHNKFFTNELKKNKKDQQNQITTLKTSRRLKQNKYNNNEQYQYHQKTQKTVNNKNGNFQYTNHIPILHLPNQKFNTESESINEYFSPINQQSQEEFFYNNHDQSKKADELNSFKYRTQIFQKNLVENEKRLLQFLQTQEHNFMQNSSYIQRSFKKLTSQIEQKQRQLLDNLFIHQQNIKNLYKQNLNQIITVKKSIQRYKNDIQRHYQQIILQLDMQQFYKIIGKYDDKISYFGRNLHQMMGSIEKQNVNVYIPIREIEKNLQKADVKYYQVTNSQQNQFNQQHNQYYSVEKVMGYDKNGNMNNNMTKNDINNNNNDQTMVINSNRQNHKRNISLKDNNMLMSSIEKRDNNKLIIR